MPTWSTTPREYPRLLRPLLDGRADAVFGSRYIAGEQTRVLLFWHSVINKGLTLLSNMFCNLNLTDMETCYKVFRTDLLKSIPIRSDRFGFEPEIVMKGASGKFRIYEVPISYHGRTYEEGKKIGWRDGMKALGVILKFWLIDDLYTAPYGRGVLNNLTGTPQYLSWLARMVRPYLGDTVLEIGAGIGNLTGRLMARRLLLRRRRKGRRSTCTRSEPLSADAQCKRAGDGPRKNGLPAAGPLRYGTLPQRARYAQDPASVVRAAAGALNPGGRLVILVPQGPGLYGTLDKAMGHRRRFAAADLRQLLEAAGLRVEKMRGLRSGFPAWFLYGKVLRRTRVSKLALKAFDKTVWIWRRVDPLMPWPPLSLIAVARHE